MARAPRNGQPDAVPPPAAAIAAVPSTDERRGSIEAALRDVAKEMGGFNSKLDQLQKDVTALGTRVGSLEHAVSRATYLFLGGLAVMTAFLTLLWWIFGDSVKMLKDAIIHPPVASAPALPPSAPPPATNTVP